MEFNLSDWHWGFFAFYTVLGVAFGRVWSLEFRDSGIYANSFSAAKDNGSKIFSTFTVLVLLAIVGIAHETAQISRIWAIVSLAEVALGMFIARKLFG